MKKQKSKNNLSQNITLVNYADKIFTYSQKINTKSALKIGGFSMTLSYGPKDMDKSFVIKNQSILNLKRGGGYWLWKPYIIKNALERLNWDDFLFYCDSGSYFNNNIGLFLDSLEFNQDIYPFETQQIEKKWTKRDLFILMNCDKQEFYNSKQRLSGFILFKKTEFTMSFIDEWLRIVQIENAVTDMKNIYGKENYNQFVEHRHDQSIFSLLTKKYNLKAHRDPSQFGNQFGEFYKTSKYPQFIVSTRKRNITFYYFKRTLIRWIEKFIKTK